MENHPAAGVHHDRSLPSHSSYNNQNFSYKLTFYIKTSQLNRNRGAINSLSQNDKVDQYNEDHKDHFI